MIRLSKAIAEFNLSKDHILKFLSEKGIKFTGGINSKLPQEAYLLLVNEFNNDKQAREAARDIYLSKLSEEYKSILNKEKAQDKIKRIPGLENLRKEAFSLIRNKKYSKALKICNKLIAKKYFTERAYNVIGIIYIRTENYEKAIENFNKAIEINFEFPSPYNNRGVAKSYLDLHKEAIADYKVGINLAKKFHEFEALEIYYRNRASSYEKINKLKLVEKDLKYAAACRDLENELPDENEKETDASNYPDGYGGTVPEKFIDEVLDGTPDAYWNLD